MIWKDCFGYEFRCTKSVHSTRHRNLVHSIFSSMDFQCYFCRPFLCFFLYYFVFGRSNMCCSLTVQLFLVRFDATKSLFLQFCLPRNSLNLNSCHNWIAASGRSREQETKFSHGRRSSCDKRWTEKKEKKNLQKDRPSKDEEKCFFF